MSIRVIAGKYRHRLISYPSSNLTRPTKDRIREALFSILGDIEGLTVLDLYAGSGALGIEALSRGAEKCYFVDNYIEAINCINNNIKNLAINNAIVINSDDITALSKLKNEGIIFDLILLDPPYLKGEYETILSFLIDNNMLNKGSQIVIERTKDINYDIFAFSKIKHYHYGEIYLDVIKY